MKVQPDWEIDAFTKAQIRSGKRHSIVTDLILKLLGLDVCFHLPSCLQLLPWSLHIICKRSLVTFAASGAAGGADAAAAAAAAPDGH